MWLQKAHLRWFRIGCLWLIPYCVSQLHGSSGCCHCIAVGHVQLLWNLSLQVQQWRLRQSQTGQQGHQRYRPNEMAQNPVKKYLYRKGQRLKLVSVRVCVVSTYMCVTLRKVTYPIMCWTYEGNLNSVAPPPFFSISAPWRDRRTCLLMHFLSSIDLFEFNYVYFDVERFYYMAHWSM